MSLERTKIVEFTTQNEAGQTISQKRKITLVPKNVKKRESWVKFGIGHTKKAYESNETISTKPEYSNETFVRYSEESDATRREKSEEELALEKLKHQKEKVLQNSLELAPSAVPGAPAAAGDITTPGPGAYVPRMMRTGGEGASALEEINTTIKVSNLGKEIDEGFLREIFRPFGIIQRCKLVCEFFVNEYGERERGESRGFAFISFDTQQQAHKAIQAMHDKILNHTVINVEMSKPKRRRPEQ